MGERFSTKARVVGRRNAEGLFTAVYVDALGYSRMPATMDPTTAAEVLEAGIVPDRHWPAMGETVPGAELALGNGPPNGGWSSVTQDRMRHVLLSLRAEAS